MEKLHLRIASPASAVRKEAKACCAAGIPTRKGDSEGSCATVCSFAHAGDARGEKQ
jgi:hypothetical protein